MIEWRPIAVPDAVLEVAELGSGDPILFIQTALTADELVPLATDAELGSHRSIVYHRRGYAGSALVDGPGSIVRDAADCAGLLSALGHEHAHVVGFSYSGAVALELTVSYPERVGTLTLIEPPPLHTPSRDEFRAANDRLIASRRERGDATALDEFLTLILGLEWRAKTETQLPGSAKQMQRDVGTFFDTDLPALFAWEFDDDRARTISCPVLHIGGTDSGPWFAEVRELVLDWFPTAVDVVIDGADHGLALTHTTEAARAIFDFIDRHPLG